MLDLLLLIVKCPFNEMKILLLAALALEHIFRLIYSNTHLNSHETVPLNHLSLLMLIYLQSFTMHTLMSNLDLQYI